MSDFDLETNMTTSDVWRPAIPVDWNRLSGGIPTRLPAWWQCWIDHFSDPAATRLVVATRSDGRVAGLLPMVVEQAKATSLHPTRYSPLRRWRLVGDGLACSDHAGLLCDGEDVPQVGKSIAERLIRSSRGSSQRWDQLKFEGVSAGDPNMGALVRALCELGASIRISSRMNLWFKPSLDDWDVFLSNQGRRIRSRLRKSIRHLDGDDHLLVHESVEGPELQSELHQLIALHQARWEADGQPGSFADPRMISFISNSVARLSEYGAARVRSLRLDDRMVAGELHLIGGDGRCYVYSSGVDVRHRDLAAGALLHAATLRLASAPCCPGVDFMRGDEEYKRRLHSQPVAVLDITVDAPTWTGVGLGRFDQMRFRGRQLARRLRGKSRAMELTLDEAFPLDEESDRWLPVPKPFASKVHRPAIDDERDETGLANADSTMLVPSMAEFPAAEVGVSG
ncbi:MAG: GNAT family N-acetyltransferase [Planctomycetota bacterium]